MSVTAETKSSVKRSRTALGIGFVLGLLLGVGMLIGSWVTMSNRQPQFAFPSTALNATATDSGENFAICTGSISDEVEGIFTLDFLTGELKGWVFDSRTGQIGGIFMHNVVVDLRMDQSGKNPHFLMVTGRTGLRGSGSEFCDLLFFLHNFTEITD